MVSYNKSPYCFYIPLTNIKNLKKKEKKEKVVPAAQTA